LPAGFVSEGNTQGRDGMEQPSENDVDVTYRAPMADEPGDGLSHNRTELIAG
jgi:hypothetical protein